ncbi:TIGR02391 family protein [Nitrobacter sp.]|uniref:TIGR02391 family protein n=1 Tax=Nitrobacter sp. TaxID=29420 RepID=UPI00399D7008
MQRSNPRPDKIPSLIKRLERRLSEVSSFTLSYEEDWYGEAKRIAINVNATIDDVFGPETADAADFQIDANWFTGLYLREDAAKRQRFTAALARTRKLLGDAIKRLQEKIADADDDADNKVIRAYQGLELHSEIARAANELYLDGHYANAIEDAVKALNDFVRLRSGVDNKDGMELMEFVFSPKQPLLAFNALKDDSDRNEQKGFMMMLSGAVAGLRNPRAHSLVKDDPERALEFIAYVSLLAKLVDEAKKRPSRKEAAA